MTGERTAELALYDHTANKLTIVLSSRLDDRTAINTVGHVATALGAQLDRHAVGHRWPDADDHVHAALARYPLIVLAARPGKIRTLIHTAQNDAGLLLVDYPELGFTTTNDNDYRNALATVHETDITYIAVGIFGPSASVNNFCSKFTLWSPRS